MRDSASSSDPFPITYIYNDILNPNGRVTVCQYASLPGGDSLHKRLVLSCFVLSWLGILKRKFHEKEDQKIEKQQEEGRRRKKA